MRAHTVRSSREIDAIFRDGRRIAHPLVLALTRETPNGRGPEGRVAFVAGKRLGGAVSRNRAKRRLRAAFRIAGGPWPGHDVVLVARRDLLEAPVAQIEAALRRIGERLRA